ncbi:hypothetical protein ACFWDI_35645 [Streptomyces sp. NPDC060064]|uniref:hypothetical protein n=1 Tax=Streptomyces sp. NPDC060064 TaxID=3347049 RepID=UPI0036CDE51C
MRRSAPKPLRRLSVRLWRTLRSTLAGGRPATDEELLRVLRSGNARCFSGGAGGVR